MIGSIAQTFSFADSQILVYDSLRNGVHEGLCFAVRLNADDLFLAMKKSLPTVLPLASMLAVAHSTAIDNPHVMFGLDLDNARTDRQFGQVLYNIPTAWLHRRNFDRDTFAPILNGFTEANIDVQHALISAMFHLRKSYNSTTLLDEFFELYSGLESLNSSLQKKYGLPTAETRQCACGVETKTPVATGIKQAIVHLARKETDVWKSVRKTRIDIVHRHSGLPNVNTGLYENVLVVRQALRAAILDLMNLPFDAAASHISIQEPLSILVTATLTGISADKILESGPVPQFVLEHAEEIVPAKVGPTFDEPIAAQLYIGLRNFDGKCDENLAARIWTGKYYDLPSGAAENRRTQFIARLSRTPFGGMTQ